jgi:hypothetical protein
MPDDQAKQDRMREALRRIAAFPHAPENRDLTFSQAVAAMANIALAALEE